MRVYFLYVVIAALSIVGFRSWFVPLCSLIVLTAFMERADMPSNVMGVPGANPWNLLLLVVLVHWWCQRRSEGARWDLGAWPALIVTAYVTVLVVGFIRASLDMSSLASSSGARIQDNYSALGLFVDELVNPLRYMIPGFLVYDGCRTRSRCKMAIGAVCLMGVCYAAFVVKYLPMGTVLDAAPNLGSRRRVDREIGLHANDMAFVLVFVFWSIVASWPMLRNLWLKLLAMGSMGIVFLGVALCQSRAGFIGFAAVGTSLAALRRPILLVFLPVGVAVIPIVFPGVAARLGSGFGESSASGETVSNWDEITAGRLTNLWPVAIQYIGQAPVVGYGRYAMLRVQGLYQGILEREGAVPRHPHNAYLEVLLDYGGVGLVVVLALFLGVLRIAIRQMRHANEPFIRVIGTIAFVAAVDNLVVGISSRGLLPRPSALAMWCAFALSLRLWEEQRRAATNPSLVTDRLGRLRHRKGGIS